MMVPILSALTGVGFGFGYWCASYVTMWKLRRLYNREHAAAMLLVQAPFADEQTLTWYDGNLDGIRKCMGETP